MDKLIPKNKPAKDEPPRREPVRQSPPLTQYEARVQLGWNLCEAARNGRLLR